MRVLFKTFDSKMASREKLFKHAADFASTLGPDRLISLSHSEDRDNIVITIWYWGGDEDFKRESKGKPIQMPKTSDTIPIQIKPITRDSFLTDAPPPGTPTADNP